MDEKFIVKCSCLSLYLLTQLCHKQSTKVIILASLRPHKLLTHYLL